MTTPRNDLGIWLPTIATGTGTEIFTVRLSEALNRRGIRTEIAWLPHRAEYAPWTVQPPKPPPWTDIVHINSWLHRRFIPSGFPLVVTLHSCVHDPACAPYKNRARTLYHRAWIRACEARTIARATAVTAVSLYTAARAAEVFGRKDIIPIHNWIDLQRYSPIPRENPQQPFRLLFIGKPGRLKGFDLLPEILRRLGTDFALHYTGTRADFGPGPDVPENLIALGRLNGDAALVDAYRNSDALLCPTRLEGLSLVTLEAQACGLPVIATDGSSLPEVIERNCTGILCPVDCVDAFVAAARYLRDHIDVWRRMSAAARTRATELFGDDRAIDAYLAVYRRLRMLA